MASDLEVIRLDNSIVNREKTVAWMQGMIGVLNAVQQCASGAVASYGASCSTTALTSASYLVVAQLQSEILDAQQEQKWLRFRQSTQERMDAIATLGETLSSSSDAIGAVLARIQTQRSAARSALARAAFADSNAASRHYPVNTAMRRTYNANVYRYQDALRAARRSAIVARGAVEQRFGVNLDDVQCASQVDAPSGWASDVCNVTGVNYAELRDPDLADPTAETTRQMFIGDYVRRLEQYVDSYRFDNPYRSSDDRTVLSVRDDLMRVRGECTLSVDNALGASNDLDAPYLPLPSGGVDESLPVAWHIPEGGCGTADPAVNCVDAQAVAGPATTLSGRQVGAFGGHEPRGFRVTFARGAPTGSSDYTDAAAWVEELLLPGGTYRLSWYERDEAMNESEVLALVNGSPPSSSNRFFAMPEVEPELANGWSRQFYFFTVPSTGSDATVRVGIFPAAMEGSIHEQTIEVAGLQLENVSHTPAAGSWPTAQYDVNAAASIYYPSPFVATTAPSSARVEGCLSADPVDFANGWSYACENLCSGGYASKCAPGEEPETLCFWRTSFPITETALLGREGPFGGGFAYANFNYRAGDLAVNVVGTGLRDCEGPDSRSCYSNASIPFSLYHTPLGGGSGYTVRGHDGSLHFVDLFPGRIENGRALAAERYLTNPLSSADEALLSDYQRGELRGRPLTGNYELRIWDTGDLDFSAVEDVQIIWNYRYFTRTGEALSCTPGD